MGIIAKILGAVPRDEQNGISLNLNEPFWELAGETTFPCLLSELPPLLPPDSILYFEGDSPPENLQVFLAKASIPEVSHIAFGTIWPRPQTYHVPASIENLSQLAKIMETKSYPELAIHFHIYVAGKVLLEWHDAFTQPMLLCNSLTEEAVQKFSQVIGMKAKLVKPQPAIK